MSLSYNRPPDGLSSLFTRLGFNSAVCKVCGAKVKANALAYSGHLRGKRHQAAVEAAKP